jgi:hypothetical protein
MANREHKTRQKMTFRVAAPKPRNPLVAPAIKRVAGPHRKSTGATRAAERIELLRRLKKPDAE